MDSKKDIKEVRIQDTFTEKYNLPDPVCINKWAWSTIQLSIGETQSCHRVDGDSISPESYGNFHNTPSKLRDRKRMLDGHWPDTNGPTPLRPNHGCEVCRGIETAGGISERKMMNSSSGFEDYVPKETKKDPNAIVTTPTTLEIFFNNQCNLACIYCAPKFSSLIAAENKKYGTRTDEVERVMNFRKDYKQLLTAHFDWMKENATSLVKYNILGGEPFFQPELEQNIDFFMENKCPNLMVTITSNLNVDKDRFRKKLDRLQKLITDNHIKSLTLHCSFDCWGPQIEYIRYGINLKKWEENFLILLTEYPEIELFIHSTLTAITFPTLPDLVERIKYWNLVRPVRHTVYTVDSRPFLFPGILPKEYYEKEINQSIGHYQDIIRLTENIEYKHEYENEEKMDLIEHYNKLIAQLKGYEKTFLAQKDDFKLIQKLKDYLNTNDSRRGCSWKPLWPWLDTLTNSN